MKKKMLTQLQGGAHGRPSHLREIMSRMHL